MAMHMEPSPVYSGILRSPSTPGTGSSVRFGVRMYDTGDESNLSASQSSSAPRSSSITNDNESKSSSASSDQEEQHTSMQDGSSLDISFTESFLMREVGDALAGLAEGPPAPTVKTPDTKHTWNHTAQDTLKAARHVDFEPQDTSSFSGPSETEPGSHNLTVSQRTEPASPSQQRGTTRKEQPINKKMETVAEMLSESPTIRKPYTSDSLTEKQDVGSSTAAEQLTSTPPSSPPASRKTFSSASTNSTSPNTSPPPALRENSWRSLRSFSNGSVEPYTPAKHESVQSYSGEHIPMQTESMGTDEMMAQSRFPPSTSASLQSPLTPESYSSKTSVSEKPSDKQPPSNFTNLPSQRSLSRPRESLLRYSHTTTPGRDSSNVSSFASWATPRSDTVSLNSPDSSHRSTSQRDRAEMYEFSDLTEKDELDKEEAGSLIPYAVNALTDKLVMIETKGDLDIKEMLETVAQLDRTHTERTIFLQHRLARSYRLNQTLRNNLDQAYEHLRILEAQIAGILTDKPNAFTISRLELQSIAEKLESQLRLLPADAIQSSDQSAVSTMQITPREANRMVEQSVISDMDKLHTDHQRTEAQLSPHKDQKWTLLRQEYDKLAQDRAQLEAERHDLEIRMAFIPDYDAVPKVEVEQQISRAVSIARESCLHDFEVRLAQAKQVSEMEKSNDDEKQVEVQAELNALRAKVQSLEQGNEQLIRAHRSEILDLQNLQSGNVESRNNELHSRVVQLEESLDKAQVEASEARDQLENCKFESLEARLGIDQRVSELENKVREGVSAILQLSKAKQEAEANLTATIHSQKNRIYALEHEVAHRGLEVVKLEKQKEHLVKEALHFSLALSAKDQELQMLKRGTQGPSAPRYLSNRHKSSEPRILQPRSTNEGRRASSEAAKRLVRATQPSFELASTPNPTLKRGSNRYRSLLSSQLPDLSTSTIDSAELSHKI
ncbi:hypothetical protein MYAM1_000649 [Malassezia yamatoensis]|uniref:Uncharacterized protein n=1 Tax=Malassezia yamatoensis TaxID=253288 RepID=A0AAJ5YWX1_9BASI|nr:hypothetical protein MYAM1_000649 [Malassezia yamatoensis]